MFEDNNQKILVIAIVAVVLILLIGWWPYKKEGGQPTGYPGGATGPDGASAVSATRQPAPSNVSVPEMNSANVLANVAKPDVVGPANPSGNRSFRGFTINIKDNAFSPNTVIVKAGDTAHINFTAVDKDYDFTQPDYGFYVFIPKGQTKFAEFSATAEGKFTFYCKVCGGLSKGTTGEIVVVPE